MEIIVPVVVMEWGEEEEISCNIAVIVVKALKLIRLVGTAAADLVVVIVAVVQEACLLTCLTRVCFALYVIVVVKRFLVVAVTLGPIMNGSWNVSTVQMYFLNI